MEGTEPRWLAFVRHAEYDKITAGGPRNARQPLTALGVTQADATGDFLAGALREHGLRVTEVVTTDTRRTQQTADAILARLDGPAPMRRVASLGVRATVAERMTRWVNALQTGELVLVVGHRETLPAVAIQVGIHPEAFARLHAAVVLCRYDAEGWTQVAFFPRKWVLPGRPACLDPPFMVASIVTCSASTPSRSAGETPRPAFAHLHPGGVPCRRDGAGSSPAGFPPQK